MKRFFLIIVFLLIPLIFSGCTFNWIQNGKQVHYEIHWLFIAVPLFLIFLICCLVTIKRATSKYYICPHCSHRFKPKWYQAFFTTERRPRSGGVFKCPNCHKRDVMKFDVENDRNKNF